MRYELSPNKPRSLDRVVAGNASDARWRSCLGPAYQGTNEDGDRVYQIDSVIAHEIERQAESDRHDPSHS
jgi:hypothetical protein